MAERAVDLRVMGSVQVEEAANAIRNLNRLFPELGGHARTLAASLNPLNTTLNGLGTSGNKGAASLERLAGIMPTITAHSRAAATEIGAVARATQALGITSDKLRADLKALAGSLDTVARRAKAGVGQIDINITVLGRQAVMDASDAFDRLTASVAAAKAELRGMGAVFTPFETSTKAMTAQVDAAILRVNDLDASLKKLAATASTTKPSQIAATATGTGTAALLTGAGFAINGATALAAGTAGAAYLGSNVEATLVRVRNNTEITNAQFALFRANVLGLYRETGEPIEKIAMAMSHAANYGFQLADAMKIANVATKAAVATGGDAERYGQLLAKTLYEFNAPASEASKYMDILYIAAKRSDATMNQFVESGRTAIAMGATLKISAVETAAALSVLGRGLSQAEASTQLRGILSNITKGGANNKVRATLQDLTAQTGVNLVGDFSVQGLQARQLSGIFDDVREAAQRAKIPVEELTVRLFPNLRGTIGALKETSGQSFGDQIKLLHDLAHAGQGASEVQDAYNRSIDTADRKFKILRAELESKFIPVGRDLATAFLKMAPALTTVANSLATLAQWFSQLPTPIQQATIAIGGFGLALRALGGASLIASLGTLGNTLRGLLPTLATLGQLSPTGAAAKGAVGLGALKTGGLYAGTVAGGVAIGYGAAGLIGDNTNFYGYSLQHMADGWHVVKGPNAGRDAQGNTINPLHEEWEARFGGTGASSQVAAALKQPKQAQSLLLTLASAAEDNFRRTPGLRNYRGQLTADDFAHDEQIPSDQVGPLLKQFGVKTYPDLLRVARGIRAGQFGKGAGVAHYAQLAGQQGMTVIVPDPGDKTPPHADTPLAPAGAGKTPETPEERQRRLLDEARTASDLAQTHLDFLKSVMPIESQTVRTAAHAAQDAAIRMAVLSGDASLAEQLGVNHGPMMAGPLFDVNKETFEQRKQKAADRQKRIEEQVESRRDVLEAMEAEQHATNQFLEEMQKDRTERDAEALSARLRLPRQNYEERVRQLGLARRPNLLGLDQTKAEGEQLQGVYSAAQDAAASAALNLMLSPTEEAGQQFRELTQILEDAAKALQDHRDKVDADAQALTTKRVLDDADVQEKLISDSYRRARGYRSDPDREALLDLNRLYAIAGLRAGTLAQLMGTPGATPAEIEAARKRAEEAAGQYSETRESIPRDRYNRAYGQAIQGGGDALHAYLQGRGNAGDVFRGLGDQVIGNALNPLINRVMDPFARSVATQVTHLDENTMALKQLGVLIGGTGGAVPGGKGLIDALAPAAGASGGNAGLAATAAAMAGVAAIGHRPSSSSREQAQAPHAGHAGSASSSMGSSTGKLGGKGTLGQLAAGYSMFANGSENGVNLGNLLGSAATGMEMGGPVGALLGLGSTILGGLFGHRRKKRVDPQQDYSGQFDGAPDKFFFEAYRARLVDQFGLPSQLKVAPRTFVQGVSPAMLAANAAPIVAQAAPPIVHVYLGDQRATAEKVVYEQTSSAAAYASTYTSPRAV